MSLKGMAICLTNPVRPGRLACMRMRRMKVEVEGETAVYHRVSRIVGGQFLINWSSPSFCVKTAGNRPCLLSYPYFCYC